MVLVELPLADRANCKITKGPSERPRVTENSRNVHRVATPSPKCLEDAITTLGTRLAPTEKISSTARWGFFSALSTAHVNSRFETDRPICRRISCMFRHRYFGALSWRSSMYEFYFQRSSSSRFYKSWDFSADFSAGETAEKDGWTWVINLCCHEDLLQVFVHLTAYPQSLRNLISLRACFHFNLPVRGITLTSDIALTALVVKSLYDLGSYRGYHSCKLHRNRN